MHHADRSPRSMGLVGAVVLACSALVSTAHASDLGAGAVRPSAGPAPGPVFVSHGSIAVPSSLAQGVTCPDAATNGAAGWVVEGVTPGRVFSLRADDAGYRNDFDIHFYRSLAACMADEIPLPHRNHAGDENAVVPDGAAVGVVVLRTGSPASFTYAELAGDDFRRFGGKRRVTTVAVIDLLSGGGYSPYHNDFLGSHHPWNIDGDDGNDLDFGVDPADYIPGFPQAVPLDLTLPTSDSDLVADLAAKDASKWMDMKGYTNTEPNLYWLPGTKVVAAASFGPNPDGHMLGTNLSHATRTASVAAGNHHGTCPECVFVLLGGNTSEALKWALGQRWIDVVVNSFIGQEDLAKPLDLMYLRGDVAATREAVEAGQTIVWGAGNGTANRMGETPSTTYTSSERGPDWIVTTGAVFTQTDQPLRGSGRPADVAAYGDQYPSAGGYTPNETGDFGGTSNAAPVVAGTFARVIQRARELVGDVAALRRKGEVAHGPGRPCFRSPFRCPLDDGVLTREEMQAVVFDNVRPSMADVTADYLEPALPLLPGGNPSNTPTRTDLQYSAYAPPTDFKPAAVGHGIVFGRLDAARFVAEQRRFDDALRGAVEPYPRPPGERAWLLADSKCRQRMWGTWAGGYSEAGEVPSFGPDDAVGAAWYAKCSALPQDAMFTVASLAPNGGIGIN